MRINFKDIDTDSFDLKYGTVAGETCVLVTPKLIGCKWDKKNLHFRSSMWNSDGELISASFKKFFNWNEQPNLTYTPFSTTANGGIDVMSKIDGSTLIISKYNDELIIRTRGSFDATQLRTGEEIELLKEKYPRVFNFHDSFPVSYIYEWVTPDNKIVLNYPEPDIYLIGAVKHYDYSLARQNVLDEYAKEIGVKRPERYHFDSIKQMLEEVPTWENREGVCVYCNNGQDIRKIKGTWYLTLHRMKSELGSFERVVDFYFENGAKSYQETYNIIAETLDYEIAENCRGFLSSICDAMTEVKDIVDSMREKVENIKLLKTRKEQAEVILQKWGITNRASFAFLLLDGKELDRDNYKKLLYQVVKK